MRASQTAVRAFRTMYLAERGGRGSSERGFPLLPDFDPDSNYEAKLPNSTISRRQLSLEFLSNTTVLRSGASSCDILRGEWCNHCGPVGDLGIRHV